MGSRHAPDSETHVSRQRGVDTARFTLARVVALVVIGLVLVGLVFVRFGSGSHALAVPSGAKAGDLTLHGCSYRTEGGSLPADCGTLVVPENRNNPQPRLIALPVTRIRARNENAGEPVFWMEGGPGQSNMNFRSANRLAQDRDVVLVGYRGADGSSVLNCPEVESALQHSTDFLGKDSFVAFANGLRSCATRLTDSGVDLAGYSMSEQADDFEAARRALGYGPIDLLSQSAGTRLAMIYAWRYPANVHRSAMLAVNPPGHFVWDGATTDAQIAQYSALCAQDSSCRSRTDDLVASMRNTSANMPDRWWIFPIKAANVKIASFYGSMETTTSAGPLNGPATVDSWLSAAHGDASGFWLASVAGDLIFPKGFVWGEYAAIGFQDKYVADAYFAAGGDHGSILNNAGTDFNWGGGYIGDAWPTSPDDAQYRQVQTSPAETLLISGELDFATPPQNATKDLLPYLPNGHQVVLTGLGHTISFWSEQKDAANRLLNTFFSTGQADQSLYKPGTVDFTPDTRQTSLAKIVASAMMALALLTVLSLAWWMPRKVHKRGRFGPKTSVATRSLYAIVLGLGGWILGALIILVTMPGVRIDNKLMTVTLVGLTVGLGCYWAGVHRDSSARTKATGFAAAAGGALLGAWLGATAMAGFVSLFTAVAGAIAVTNLALMLYDLWREDLTAQATPPLDLREHRNQPVPTGVGAS